MGYLTTLNFLNDASDQYDKHPERLVEIISDAITNHKCSRNGGHSYEEGIGNHANAITVQRSRHADDHTIYIHMGNCVSEVNPWSADTKDVLERFPDVFDQYVSFMDQQVKQLKKMKKEHLARKYNLSDDGLEVLKNRIRNLHAKLKAEGNENVKILCIKEIRAYTGYSLKDAIDFYEAL